MNPKIKNIVLVLALALVLIFVIPDRSIGATFSWTDISSKGKKNGLVSDRKAGETDIVLSTGGNIFAAYQYRNNRVQVKKFDGARWVELSDASNPKGLISTKRGGNPTLATKNSEVYVAFMDYANGIRAKIKKWDGGAWSDLSDAEHPAGMISAARGFEPVLCFDNSGENLYAAFRDEASGERIKVMKWAENSGWIDVADSNNPGGLISGGVASEVELKASKTNNDIYAAFEDHLNSGRIKVKKWDGSIWQDLSDGSHPEGLISSIEGFSPSIDLDSAGNLYLVYTGKNAKNTYIHKWNGNNWENIGNGVAVKGKTIESAIAIDQRNFLYLAYSKKTKSGWRVRAKILKDSVWLDVKFRKSKNISKGKGKGDPALAIFENKLYMSFTDARQKNKARVKMLNFEP